MRLWSLLIFALTSTSLRAQSDWVRANAAVVRLAPSRFPTLPTAVRADLERRTCRIPQSGFTADAKDPHNVLRGAFTARGRVDWAVLCSVRDSSQILIYHDGTASPSDSLAKSADFDFLQGLGEGRIGFSRRISIATAASIRDHAKAYEGPKPPSVLDHVGIDDAFQGKASVILYWFGGKWLALQGADVP